MIMLETSTDRSTRGRFGSVFDLVEGGQVIGTIKRMHTNRPNRGNWWRVNIGQQTLLFGRNEKDKLCQTLGVKF
jgi:hypothetical protein